MNIKNLYDWDDSLFNDMVWPSDCDAELCVQNIILKCGLMTPLYNDPSFLKMMQSSWSKIHLDDFTRYWNALHTEYNPLENYDRITNGSRVITDDGSYNNKNGGVSTDQVSAFNSSSWQNNQKNEIDNTSNGTNDNERREGYGERVHGNIGVTTSQQMLESELKIADYNFYDYVAERYAQDFCLGVYE